MKGLAAAILLVTGLPVGAQGQEDGQQRQQELEKLREMEKREFYGEPVDHFYFDYGAWVRPGWFSYEDGSGSETSQADIDVRLWLDMRYGVHQLYARIITDYSNYAHNDGPDGDDHDLDGPRPDVLFYQIHLGELIGEPDRNWDLTARAGRQYLQFGGGLVFNNIADGIVLRGNVGSFPFELFGLRSMTHENDLDQSRPNPDETERIFIGGAVRYTGILDQLPYLAVLVERDRLDEDPENGFQDYEFDAEYFGLGMEGKIAEGFFYEWEAWYQTGERFAHLQTDSGEDIEAFAFTSSLEYRFYSRTHPVLELGVMFGSGDADRFRILNSEFGNQIGTSDRAFLGFGYIPTGYSLSPYLSNLWIFHLGGSIRPLMEETVFTVPMDGLELSLDFYYYRKHLEEGGISDPYADFEHAEIGYEVDFSVNWTVFSDVNFMGRSGFFKPGSAYDRDEVRSYVSLSLLFAF